MSCSFYNQVQFEKQGGILKDEEKVLNIIPGRYVVVYTNKAVHRANSVVITPGAWASKLLKPLGLNIPLQVSISERMSLTDQSEWEQ